MRWRWSPLDTATLSALTQATADEFSTLPRIELSTDVVRGARQLLLGHPLRANDAIQLASCVLLQEQLAAPVSSLSFDDRLNAAALREGLQPPEL